MAKKDEWHKYPDERPQNIGYYRVEAKTGAKAAGFWNGFAWEYDIVNTKLRASLRAEFVERWKEWE